MFRKGKHAKKSAHRKHVNILLCVLLVVSLVFAGTVLGKYIVEKTLDDKLNLTITGAPQGNTLMVGAVWEDGMEYVGSTTDGFIHRIKALSDDGLGSSEATKIVFCGKDSLPNDLVSDWDTDGVNVDAADKGAVKAFYDNATTTIYVASYDNQMIATNRDAGYMFFDMWSLAAIDGLDFVDTSKTTNMEYMFSDNMALTTMDVSGFDTSKVTDMSAMFSGCYSLNELDVSGFDTSNVTSMYSMFAYCGTLQELDVSGFNTSKVADMSIMFSSCSGLTELDVSGFDTENVTNMASMFDSCTKLTYLKLTGWNTEKVSSMKLMFEGCTGLTELNLAGWNTANVTDMSGMFSGCTALTTIYANDSWSIAAVTSDADMFKNCTVLAGGQGTSFAVKQSTDSTYAVIDRVQEGGAEGYLTLYEAYTLISGYNFNWMLWDGDGVEDYYDLPDGMIEWEGFDGGDVRITKIVFGSFEQYKDELGLTSWDDIAPGIALDAEQQGNIRLYIPDFTWSNTQGTSYDQTYYVLSKNNSIILANEDCSYMFRNDWTETEFSPTWRSEGSLSEIVGLELIDTGNVTNMSTMFASCSVKEINLSNFDTSKVTDMSWMFAGCYLGTPLDVSNFDTSKVTNMSGMFQYYSLDTEIDLDLTHFDTSKVTNMSHMFDGASALKSIDVSKFDTSKVTNMGSMFSGLYYVTKLDLSNFNTANVTDMSYMFSYSSALTDLNVLSFDTGKVTKMNYMFGECSALQKLDISSFSTTGAVNAADEGVTYVNIAYMFYNCPKLEVIYASSELWDHTQVGVGDGNWSQVFYNDTVLVGGEGSTYSETASGDNYGDYKYARIDAKVSVGDDAKGLFTDKNAPPTGDFTLKKGTEFNSAVSGLISSSSATKIQFGSWAQYGAAKGFDWTNGTEVGVVDGTIKAFTKDGIVYILSGGNMYANADSSTMFKNMTTLTAIDGLSAVNTGNVTNMSEMFYYCNSLTSLDVSGFDTSKVTNMSKMFHSCASYYLTTLDVSGWNTSSVTDMSGMFNHCYFLTSLDVSNWDTAKVTDMNNMFGYCYFLTSLNVSGWNTSSVTDMNNMFYECNALTTLDVSGWKTDLVTDMNNMFYDCNALTSLDVSGWDTSLVTDMNNMFYSCSGLTSLDVSGWNTDSVENMSYMFDNCASLTSLDLTDWDTSSVTNMSRMFASCKALTTIYASEAFVTEQVTESSNMFYNCNALKGGMGTTLATTGNVVDSTYARIDGLNDLLGYFSYKVPTGDYTLKTGTEFNAIIAGLVSDDSSLTKVQFGSWDTYGQGKLAWTKGTDVGVDEGTIRAFTSGDTIYILSGGDMYANADSSSMFKHNYTTSADVVLVSGCIAQGQLTAIEGLASVNTSRVTNMNRMFMYAMNLATLDVASFDTGSVTDMGYMFYLCSALTELDLSKFVTSSVTDMNSMFDACSALTKLDVSNFDTSSVKDMTRMFYACSALTELDVSDFDTSSVTTMANMFTNCNALTSLDLSGWDTGNVQTMNRMFGMCSALTQLDVSNFDTSSVTNMGLMFYYCDALTSLDVSGFDTSNVSNMASMFSRCKALTSLDISNFDTSKVTDMSAMFSYCSSLTSLDVSNFDTSKVTDMGYMFDTCSGLTELDVSGWNTAKVSDMRRMFFGCTNLATIYATTGFTTAAITEGTYDDSMFYNCTALVGGEGTAYDANVTDKTYAHIDGGTASPGYLTEIPTYTLTTGSAFNTAIKDLFSTDVTKLQFGSFSKYGAANGLSWDASTTYVDAAGTGTIRVFTSGDTVYVLSQNVSRIAFNANSSHMFYGGTSYTDDALYSLGKYLKEIKGLNKVVTSGVTSMTYMFQYARALTTVDVSKFDTSSVTNMNQMFWYCDSVLELDVSDWDTSKVTTMYAMFMSCAKLTSLDVSGWDTSNVTNMSALFVSCYRLTSLDVSNWDTSNVQYMSQLFSGCSGLTSLDVSNWDTSNVTTMSSMFSHCRGLTTLNLSNFDTSSVTAMNHMFSSCTGLTSLNISSFDTSKVTNMSSMFIGCTGLTSLDLSNFETSLVTNMGSMFSGCTNLATIYATPGFTTTAITEDANDDNMFFGCTALKGGEGTAFDSSVIDKTYAKIDGGTSDPGYFTYGAVLKDGATVNTGYFWNNNPTTIVFGKYSDYSGTVGTWTSGTVLDSRNAGTIRGFSSGTTVYVLTRSGQMRLNPNSTQLFRGDWSRTFNLTTIEGLANLDTSKVTKMDTMFQYCKKLTSVDLSSWDTSNVTTMKQMFDTCYALKTANLAGWNTSKVTTMANMFYDCTALESLDLSSWNTSKVTTMYMMFHNCKALTELDLSSFDVSNVTSMDSMFANCGKLAVIYANNWQINSKVTSGEYSGDSSMFSECTSLVGGAGSTYEELMENYAWPYDNPSEFARIDIRCTITDCTTCADYGLSGCSNNAPGFFTDPAQKASASALSLDGADEAEAEETDTTAESAADSTVEAILPQSQTKEESESETEPDADNSDTEEE